MRKNAIFSPSRIGVIAGHTFTQLVRMKVFYFLAVFAVLMLVASYFEMPWSRTTEDTAEQELVILKSTAMGAMAMFSVLFAIAATALLIPKDLEDRTLYTILSKPVPRLDYLLGKLLGVLFLVGSSLLIMDVLLTAILHVRTDGLIAAEMERGMSLGWPQEYLDIRKQEIAQQGPTWDLQAGIGAIFFKAMIMASIALLISTFSSSTLFTIVIAVVIYFIGHFTADARNYWLHKEGAEISFQAKIFSQAISLIFPDFQLYNIVDASIEGKKIGASIFNRLLVLTLFYTGIYSVLSWFTFRKKEF
ncbi:ABC transporter permease subunit [Verrucomicrobiaceae bacterium 5K15]|uniref:ABC transporter permease subunit n=1 Tax=Oceaniferula flava TaxID=2800421 RepID=A0AAE2SBF7_9BACT|nr:ABC transporter permease subunit [Oceaniferula flavus]MBK1854659.1 ABC transporter permease subunit [Oceaniferula flavus]MBM1135965.1 ABC transporter permease subunit [Oceaniferula flavus]